jgi:hypothetical protein
MRLVFSVVKSRSDRHGGQVRPRLLLAGGTQLVEQSALGVLANAGHGKRDPILVTARRVDLQTVSVHDAEKLSATAAAPLGTMVEHECLLFVSAPPVGAEAPVTRTGVPVLETSRSRVAVG